MNQPVLYLCVLPDLSPNYPPLLSLLMDSHHHRFRVLRRNINFGKSSSCLTTERASGFPDVANIDKYEHFVKEPITL